jgi:hypothetical protein
MFETLWSAVPTYTSVGRSEGGIPPDQTVLEAWREFAPQAPRHDSILINYNVKTYRILMTVQLIALSTNACRKYLVTPLDSLRYTGEL